MLLRLLLSVFHCLLLNGIVESVILDGLSEFEKLFSVKHLLNDLLFDSNNIILLFIS